MKNPNKDLINKLIGERLLLYAKIRKMTKAGDTAVLYANKSLLPQAVQKIRDDWEESKKNL